MNPSKQREYFEFRRNRRAVFGRWWVDGKLVLRRLASWDEVGISGLRKDDEKNKLVPIWRQGARRKGLNTLTRLYFEVEEALKTEPVAQPDRTPMQDVIQAWLLACEITHSAGSRDWMTRTGNRYIEACGNHPVSDFSLRHLDKFIAYLSAPPKPTKYRPHPRPPNNSTINIYLRTLRAMLNWARERDYLEGFPKFKEIKTTRRIPTAPSDEEVVQLLQKIIDKRQSARNRREARYLLLQERFLMIASGTGARRNEVALAPWEAIDFDAGKLMIRKSLRFDSKERREKDLPLPDYLLGYLMAQRQAGENEVWILDNGKGELAYSDPHSITTAIRRHKTTLNLGEWKPTHGFRAMYATKLRNVMGVDSRTISGLLGHSRIETTEAYFAGEEAKMTAAVKLLDAAPVIIPRTNREQSGDGKSKLLKKGGKKTTDPGL